MTTKFEHTIYKNYITTHFSSFSPELQTAYNSRYYLWASYMADLLPKDKRARILEIGCGMGHNLFALKRLGYVNSVGFDISHDCVEFCKRHKFDMLPASDIDKVIKLTSKNYLYETIVIYDLLEHFNPEEAVSFLTKYKKLLKPNGTILISTPNGEFPLNMPIRYVDISHKFLYTYSSISQVLVLSGLQVKFLRSVPSFTIIDDNMLKQLFKKYIMLPLSKIGKLFMQLYLLSYGIRLHYPEPQLLCVAEMK